MSCFVVLFSCVFIYDVMLGVGSGPLLRFFIEGGERAMSQEALARMDMLVDLASPICLRRNLELYDVELKQYAKNLLVRVFIDRDTGVSVEDCADVSRELSELLDGNEIFTEAYVLEVSSPGIDRKLLTPKHYRDNLGSAVKLILREPMEGQMRLQGQLSQLADDGLTLVVQVKQREIELSLAAIAECRVVPDFKKNSGRVK